MTTFIKCQKLIESGQMLPFSQAAERSTEKGLQYHRLPPCQRHLVFVRKLK